MEKNWQNISLCLLQLSQITFLDEGPGRGI